MTPPFLERIRTQLLRLDAMREFMVKVGAPVLVTSLTLTGLILMIRHVGLLQGSELAAYDHFMQMKPVQEEDDRLLVVGIDEIDLQTLQEWPISDRTLANLVQKLEAHHPKAIGIDVFRDIPIEPGRQELLKQLTHSKRVVIVCKVNSAREFGVAPPPGVPLDNVGSADLVIDPGGILRRTLLWITPPKDAGLIITKHHCNNPNNNLLSFSLNLTLTYLQSFKIEPEITDTGALKLGRAIIPPFQANMGGYRNADASGYQLLLRYRSKENVAHQVRLTEVLNGQVAPDLIRDRIVLVGYTTPQAKDDFYTPYSSGKLDLQKMPGVIVHAQSVSQILDAVLDGKPLIWVWSIAAEIVWIFAWSLVGGLLAWYIRHPFSFSLVVIGVSSTIYVVSLLTFFQAGWIPVVPAIAAFISTAVGVVLFDRFNNSAYGQTVYKTVKTFLKLEVDIDDEKVEKQVSEIIETDYFRDLQDTVKSLREQHSPGTATNPHNSDNPLDNSKFDSTLAPVDSQTAEDYELDFVQQLQQESYQLKANTVPLKKDDQQGNTPNNDNSDDYELDWIQSIKQTSKQFREEVAPPPPSTAKLPGDTETLIYQQFTLDDYCGPPQEMPEDLRYLADWQQQIQQLKSSKADDKKP